MHGAVSVTGTRIPASIVLDNLAAGHPPELILSEYPSLRVEHIPAAMSYAAELSRERIVSVPVKAWASELARAADSNFKHW
jgi:uncharacterized protein (DUF433 family)